MKRFALFALLSAAPLTFAQSVTVTGGKTDARNVVVTVPLKFGADIDIDGVHAYGQSSGKEQSQFVLGRLNAGQVVSMKGYAFDPKGPQPGAPPSFDLVEKPSEFVDAVWNNGPVYRYVFKPHDEKNHYLTFKPFHQVFDPKDGKKLISSGAHPDTKEVLYPHHRGLFYGFNKISYDTDAGKSMKADIWHGTNKVYSTHEKFLAREAGPVFAKVSSLISWHGTDGATFAEETRTVTAYRVEGGTMLDWTSELTTKLDSVKLDGDPQHAGFHFRAHQDVAMKIEAEKAAAKKENRKVEPASTYYLRPDGKGKPGETRNWDADEKKRDANTTDLPWDACSFELDDQRYTVLRIAHPGNPKGTRGSERDYGRFGDYFEFELTPKKSLTLQYRIWVQRGAMKVEECEEMARGFTEAPKVEVKK